MRPVSLELDSAELAATYDATSLHQFTHGQALVAELSLRPGQRVLDVGCGTGRLGAYVASLVAPDGEVVGIDPLPLRVELAAQKHPLFRARVASAEDLSAFADDSFDAAYANSVFHWVERKPVALREAFRVLARGGRIALNSADADRPHQSSRLFREVLLQAGVAGASSVNTHGPPFRVNASTLGELLQQAGFVDVRVWNHVAVDIMSDTDEYVEWMRSSTFGNFLLDVSSPDRERARALLEQKLEALRTPAGIPLERYLAFAAAQKP
ncbi:MAG TPA: methyltransferase domain-containing protein [Polyangiales bacterium]|nr:methyltransferase domain-containing protein [Polyangiales bacterium]